MGRRPDDHSPRQSPTPASVLVAMNGAKYEGLAPALKKVLDDTTGLALSLKGAETYDKKCNEAIDAAKKGKEVITLSDAEAKRWTAAFRPMIEKTTADAEKAGLPARGLVNAYKLLG